MAVGYSCYLLPFDINSGGLTGAALVIAKLTGFAQLAGKSRSIFIVSQSINITLLLLAYFRVGYAFMLKSFYGSIMLPFFISFVNYFNSSFILESKLISVIAGSFFIGLASKITFLLKANTGGSDMIAQLLVFKFTKWRIGTVLMVIKIIIISSSLMFSVDNFIYSTLCAVLIGIFVNMLGRVLKGEN